MALEPAPRLIEAIARASEEQLALLNEVGERIERISALAREASTASTESSEKFFLALVTAR